MANGCHLVKSKNGLTDRREIWRGDVLTLRTVPAPCKMGT